MREARGPAGASSPRPPPRPAPAPQFGNRHLHPDHAPTQRQYASRLPHPAQRLPGADTLIAAAAPGPRSLPGSSLFRDRRAERGTLRSPTAHVSAPAPPRIPCTDPRYPPGADTLIAAAAPGPRRPGSSSCPTINTWPGRPGRRRAPQAPGPGPAPAAPLRQPTPASRVPDQRVPGADTMIAAAVPSPRPFPGKLLRDRRAERGTLRAPTAPAPAPAPTRIPLTEPCTHLGLTR